MMKTKALRSGFTTGACAAAAAKGAILTLVNQKRIEEVQITLPRGEKVMFNLNCDQFSDLQACCSVVKDAGDDPDVTEGAQILAKVAWIEGNGLTIEGGEGVGMVTKPGLPVPVGVAAINPVPRRMITQSVEEVVRLDGRGLKVVISVPRGEELARKTLNSRLGIVGGISILGTTGIVLPYSEEAFTASISCALDVALACGRQEVVLTCGRQSEQQARESLSLSEESFIQVGDFMGYALKECAKKGMARVIIWGMIGKLSKLAQGHFYTHVSSAEVDTGFLAEVARNCGVPYPPRAVSAHQFLSLLPKAFITSFCSRICSLSAHECLKHVEGKFTLECVMTDHQGKVLGTAHA
jgi:cobalt-precorrin-5B (C1)-methyltransferase